MRDCKKDFASFEDQIWLNAASEGPLPLVAAKKLEEAVQWKSKPYLLDIPKFASAQKDLKESIGRLIGVPYRDVILSNSASYGLHILANGIIWERGDEIIVMHNDFPADILPWLALEQKGVLVRQVTPRDKVIEPEELLENVTERTRLLCATVAQSPVAWLSSPPPTNAGPTNVLLIPGYGNSLPNVAVELAWMHFVAFA